jgi:hypothetical protein
MIAAQETLFSDGGEREVMIEEVDDFEDHSEERLRSR